LATNGLEGIRHRRSALGFVGPYVEKSVLAFVHPRIQGSQFCDFTASAGTATLTVTRYGWAPRSRACPVYLVAGHVRAAGRADRWRVVVLGFAAALTHLVRADVRVTAREGP
jgi:hypothetical protein